SLETLASTAELLSLETLTATAERLSLSVVMFTLCGIFIAPHPNSKHATISTAVILKIRL
ncbi:MAG: hypothetical protein RR284_09070, partial [Ruthenibacterium sp.]